MKIYRIYFLFLVLILSGCSNGGDSSNSQTSSFEIFVNGVKNEDFTTISRASKNSHTIHIGSDSFNTPFVISFDENGHFGKMVYTNYEFNGTTKKFTSFRDFSSNYFNFQLTSFDETNKRVKGNFAGYVFTDSSNLNSESKFITGSFDLPYESYVPPVANIINEATINNEYWRSTNQYQIRDLIYQYHNVTLNTVRDDQYKIMISSNDQLGGGTSVGIYNFSSADLTNKVEIAKFNTATSSYLYYNCTGTLEVTHKFNNIIQGTYSFTGVNPNNSSDQIQVQNGNFKLNYDPNS